MRLNPLSAFMQSWFPDGLAPTMDALNRVVRERGLSTGDDQPLRFVAPDANNEGCEGCEGYEARAFRSGEVATRPDNAHDLFNALIWLYFPRSKAAINRRHMQEILQSSLSSSSAPRGAVRDALTQFDECGVVVAGTQLDVWRELTAHRWREVFVMRRAELPHTTRFMLFGHASHDALRAPYIGACGKALFLPVAAADLRAIDAGDFAAVDALLAQRLLHEDLFPRMWRPLPLLGIPGATAENENPAYYDDVRQFRPARRGD